jgi:hypothetical protein
MGKLKVGVCHAALNIAFTSISKEVKNKQKNNVYLLKITFEYQ